jgi:hypothetical protein
VTDERPARGVEWNRLGRCEREEKRCEHGASVALRRLGRIGQSGHRAIVDDLAAAFRVQSAR